MPPKQVGPAVFRHPHGKMFVWKRSVPVYDGDLLLSTDGQTFWPLAVDSCNETYENGEVTQIIGFTSIYSGATGELRRFWRSSEGKWYIKYRGGFFGQQDEPFDATSKTVMPLPETRRPQYLCLMPNGSLIYVSSVAGRRPRYRDSFRLYVGSGVAMARIPLTQTIRLRSSGAIICETTEGRFCSHGEGGPQWGDVTLTELDLADYDIVEMPVMVAVTKRR